VAAYSKVIVIGLDGLEPSLVEPLLATGQLPNLARLRERGGYARVATTTPAQTPVAWSTFATGVNPGKHGIFDFVGRNPQSYLPTLALNKYEQKNAFLPPRAVNLRRAKAVWEILAAAGIPSVVLRCPCSYPPDEIGPGRLLAGMGVPDLRGGLGTATYYSTEPNLTAQESESVVALTPDAHGRFRTHLLGPYNPSTRQPTLCEFTLEPRAPGGPVVLKSAGEPAELVLEPGRWSEWVKVKFKLGLFQSIRGMFRFYLVRGAPHLALVASPGNFDPAAPMFPLSHPADYAGQLAQAIGPYATTGMIEEHGALNNGRIEEAAFLAQCQLTWDEREKMLRHELNRFERGLFFLLFDTPDRVQHMFWRFREPDHPANSAPNQMGRKGLGEFAQVIEEQYRLGDRMVGHALERADDRTLVIALSDHGFNSFRRGVHLNAWLLKQGLLALQPGVAPGHEAGDLLKRVDWSKTKAYALGLSGLYLNLQGREAKGIVSPAEAPALLRKLSEELTGLPDPEKQNVAINRALPRENVFQGPFASESPDLLVHYAAGYRTSWSTALGGVPGSDFEDNTKRWAGDHIIDPELVPGVLFLSSPFQAASSVQAISSAQTAGQTPSAGPRLLDLAPTILTALGVPRPSHLEGVSLL